MQCADDVEIVSSLDIACLVGQRPREFGGRMALGAQSGDVLRPVMGRGRQRQMFSGGDDN